MPIIMSKELGYELGYLNSSKLSKSKERSLEDGEAWKLDCSWYAFKNNGK